MPTIRFTSVLPVETGDAFTWHTRPGAFERLTPPWDDVRVVARRGDLRDGEVELSIGLGPFRQRWLARHSGYVDGQQFVDTQVAGPFARWVHTHSFAPAGRPAGTDGDDRGAVLTDAIDFALPLDPLSRPALPLVRRMLSRMFAYRHAVTQADLARHDATARRLRVAITGASGLVGRSLVPFLTTGGHEVVRLVRRRPVAPDEHAWSPAEGILDPARLGHVDAVIHLAGENVASRWNAAVKQRIRDSRVGPTTRLAASLARLPSPPSTFISASAIGYYGARGDETLTEASAPGAGFLAEVGQAWEAAAREGAPDGVRVVSARLGIVLDPRGGALGRMLWPFRLGVGGRLGSGRQYFSWVSIEDVLGALLFLLQRSDIHGPVNVTAPDPPTNAAFTRALGAALRRPTLATVPAPLLSLLVGEMADAELLASKRVVPAVLEQAGFDFLHPTLEACFDHLLGRRRLEPVA